MILVDMNQISVASMMMHLHMSKSKEIDENMVRHMILNSLRMYRTRFSSEFNELVLCYDSKHYWRRDYFPEYKFGRKKIREKSDHDWGAIFLCLNKIRDELKDNMPYKFMEVYGAEADDIIGVLCSEYSDENLVRYIRKELRIICLTIFSSISLDLLICKCIIILAREI